MDRVSTRRTVAAARRFRRRTFLALGGAAVAAAAGGAWIVGGRSSRELGLLHRSDALPSSVHSGLGAPRDVHARTKPPDRGGHVL